MCGLFKTATFAELTVAAGVLLGDVASKILHGSAVGTTTTLVKLESTASVRPKKTTRTLTNGENSLKTGSVENDKLPAGTYKDSCTECLYDKETLLLRCAGCIDSNGASRPSQLDVSSCAGGSGIGNSDGALVCNQKAGSMEIEEAKLRAKARLEARQLEELERVKQESVEEDNESKSKLSEEEAKERAKRVQEIKQRAGKLLVSQAH